MRKTWKSIKKIVLPFLGGTILILVPVAYLRQRNPEVANAAILHWGFDEGYGTTIGDSSANSNLGTITNAIWRTSDLCRKDKCLYFDGSGDYAYISDDDSGGDVDFVASDDFTIMGWFRHGTITTNPDYIVAKHESGTAGGYKVYMDSDGDIAFAIDDDGTWGPEDVVGDDQSKNYDDNKWHHFAALKDGTTGIYLYVDGVLIDSDTSLTATGTLANAADFIVGIDADGASNGWQGFIDEVKVHRELKSEAEIKADFLAGAPEEGASASFGVGDKSWLSNGLAAYWKMDETSLTEDCSTATVLDASGNGYHGEACPNGDGPTGGAGGKFGNGVTIGSNQYIHVDDNTDIRFNTGDFSIFTWMYKTSTASTPILSKLDGGDDGYEFRLLATSRVRFSMNATDGDSTSTIAADTWTHVGVVVSNGSAQIYINGVPDGSAINVSGVTMDTTTELRIGSNSSNFSGTIDDTRLYNRALSPNEVKDLYSWAPDPVLYLNFDENTGTSSVYDRSGNSNTATMDSLAESSWVPGKYGSALRFNGSSSNLSVADSASTDITGSFTLSAWIKPDSIDASGYNTLITKAIAADTATNYYLELNNSDEVNCGFYADGDYQGHSTSNSPLTTDVWQHVSCVFNTDTNLINIYVDGILKYSATETSNLVLNNHAIAIGRITTPSQLYDGDLDELRVYAYARTPAQIIEDMNGGHPAPGSPVGSPVAHWKVDEGYSTTAYDQISNNNLTLSSASWTDSGKYGKAFNGTGANRLSIADNSDFDFAAAEDFTLSVWFKSDSASNPAGNEYILDKEDGTGYAIYATTAGFITFGIDSDGTWTPADTATTSTDFYDGTWHHAVAVKTGTSRIDLYIDGILRASDTSIAATGTLENTDSLTFADQDTSDDGDEFFGDIDEISIFRLALTPSQIATLYNQGGVKLGALSTDASGNTSDSAARSYCVPGDTSTCNPPVAEWLMDENTGVAADAVKDTSENSYDGDNTSMTNANWVPGKYGSGLRFDGTSNLVDTGPITDYEGTDEMSFSAWIRPNFLNTDATTRTVFFSDRFTIAMTAPGATDDFRASLNTGASTSIDTTSVSWTYNEWHHLAFTYDGANMRIYWDGKLEATAAKTGNISTSSAASIGRNTLAVGQHWLGDLDQIRFYDYARTPAQVAWDYNRGAPIIHLKFDECTGSTANNSAPDPRGLDSGLDGAITIGPGGSNTSTGTCSSGTGTQAWNNGTTGKRNYSIDIDGTDDDVRVSNTGSIDFDDGLDEAVSFSAWIYANSDGETDVGRIFGKGSSNTYCRTDSQSGSLMDLECSMDLATTDATLNISGALTINTWHHITMTYSDDADDEITVYIDGVYRGVSTDGDGGPATDTADINVGSNGAGAATFDGQLDEFMLFNYELNQTQVKSIYNSGTVYFGPVTGAP